MHRYDMQQEISARETGLSCITTLLNLYDKVVALWVAADHLATSQPLSNTPHLNFLACTVKVVHGIEAD